MNHMSIFASKEPKISVSNIRIQPSKIEGVITGTAAFLGETEKGLTSPTLVTSWPQYQKLFGGYLAEDRFLPHTVEGFFLNGGQKCFIRKIVNADYSSALAQIEKIEEVSLIYAPNAQVVPSLPNLLIDYCERLSSCFAIFDTLRGQGLSDIAKPRDSSFAALYYPWFQVKD